MAENKLQILNNSQQFEDCKRYGLKLFVQKRLLLSYRNNNLQVHRFGWTVPKYVGTAVTRNKLKRFCREFFRANNNSSGHSFDLNVVFLKSNKDEYKKMDFNQFSKLIKPSWDSILKKS